MKNFKSLSRMAFVISLALFVWSCGGNTASEQTGEEPEVSTVEVKHGEGTAFNSAYVCPMHCEGSGSEEAGKCPACGMAYVPLAEHTKNGHTH